MIAAPLPRAARPPAAAAKEKQPDRYTLPWLEDVQPITASEASGIRDNLIEGLTAFFKGADDLISITNKEHKEAIIWQLVNDEDTAYLVDTMLLIARKVPAAAMAVRALAKVSHELRIGTILIPRFYATWQHYSSAGGFMIGGF